MADTDDPGQISRWRWVRHGVGWRMRQIKRRVRAAVSWRVRRVKRVYDDRYRPLSTRRATYVQLLNGDLAAGSKTSIVFAVDGDVVFSIVDPKPKRGPRLKRLANLEANPRVTLLVDHYVEDWRSLWWVRADGTGRVEEEGSTRDRAIELLWAKYEQYRTAWNEPVGAAVVIHVDRWRWWSLAGPQG